SRGVSFASRARLSTTSPRCCQSSAERASACATAESSSSSLNGFGKKSTAPRFIAPIPIGISPCPVIKTICSILPSSESCRWRPRPFESRQLHIEHKARWTGVRHARQILGSAGEDLDGVVLGREQIGEARPDRLVVIHHE